MKNLGILTALEVVQQDGQVLALIAVLADDSARARDNLLGITVLVNLAQTSPLTQLLGIGDLDQGNAVLSAQGLDQADVLSLVAGLGEDAELGLAGFHRLDALAQTAGQAVGVQRGAQDLAQGIFHRDGRVGSALRGGNFNYNISFRHLVFCYPH